MDENIEVELEKKLFISHESQSNCGNGNLEHTSEKMTEDLNDSPIREPDTNVIDVDQHHLAAPQKDKDAENYFSTSHGKRKLDDQETDADNYLTTTNGGKRKADDSKFLSTKINGVIDLTADGENTNSAECVPSKRNLRRLSNCKESVLQNAIALKEKSYGIRDISCYKKRKSSKGLTRQVRIQSPKTDTSAEKNPVNSNNEPTLSACLDERVDPGNVFSVSEPSEISTNVDDSKCQPEMKVNNSYSCENYSINSADLSYINEIRPIRKKKRYFKGLSYSFGRRKYSKRRKAEQLSSGHLAGVNSGQDTKLQNNINGSKAANGFASRFLFNFFLSNHTVCQSEMCKNVDAELALRHLSYYQLIDTHKQILRGYRGGGG